MKKHCGNCANHSNKTNQFSKECGMCVAAVLENGERTDPSHWREKPKTNADRIRAMTDEELAKFLCCINDCYDGKCPGKHLCQPGSNGLVEWLKQPSEESDTNNG